MKREKKDICAAISFVWSGFKGLAFLFTLLGCWNPPAYAKEDWRHFYVTQETSSGCSLATTAMLLRSLKAASCSSYLNIHPQNILQRTRSRQWQRAVQEGGSGLTLDQLSRELHGAFQAYHCDPLEIEVRHMDGDTDARLKDFVSALEKLKSGHQIIVNFDQGAVLPTAHMGHYALVAQWNARSQKVLLLDPDPEFQGAVWVPVTLLLDAMTTEDPVSHQQRGFIHISR